MGFSIRITNFCQGVLSMKQHRRYYLRWKMIRETM